MRAVLLYSKQTNVVNVLCFARSEQTPNDLSDIINAFRRSWSLGHLKYADTDNCRYNGTNSIYLSHIEVTDGLVDQKQRVRGWGTVLLADNERASAGIEPLTDALTTTPTMKKDKPEKYIYRGRCIATRQHTKEPPPNTHTHRVFTSKERLRWRAHYRILAFHGQLGQSRQKTCPKSVGNWLF